MKHNVRDEITFGQYCVIVENIPYYTMLSRDEEEAVRERYEEWQRKGATDGGSVQA